MNINLTAGQSVIDNLELGARLSFCFCNTVSLSHQDLWHMWKIFWMCFLFWEWPFSMMLSTFPPLCLSPIDHTDFVFVQLAYVLKLYGLLRFQLVVVDLNWVALITTRCCQTVNLLMSKVGPSLDPLEQQEAKNHQVVEAHTYHSEPFHNELPHTRISTGTHM